MLLIKIMKNYELWPLLSIKSHFHSEYKLVYFLVGYKSQLILILDVANNIL